MSVSYTHLGDPLDVMVLCQECIVPLTLVQCYPIGVIQMIDDSSKDEKIIAVPYRDPSLSCYRDISELPAHTMNEIQHFFTVYKSLENKETSVKETLGHEEAQRIIAYCIAEYDKHYCGKRG